MYWAGSASTSNRALICSRPERAEPTAKRPSTARLDAACRNRAPVTSRMPSSTTMSPSPRPHSTFQASISSPANAASMRGAASAPCIVPVIVPRPSTVRSPVGRPNAVMTAAMTRSLSCQSALTTSNGIRDRLPQAVLPRNVIAVRGVANQLGAMFTPSGSKVNRRSPPNGNRHGTRSGSNGCASWDHPARGSGRSPRGNSATPAGGATDISPRPYRSAKRPSGHARLSSPPSRPRGRAPATSRSSSNGSRAAARTRGANVAMPGSGTPSGFIA